MTFFTLDTSDAEALVFSFRITASLGCNLGIGEDSPVTGFAKFCRQEVVTISRIRPCLTATGDLVPSIPAMVRQEASIEHDLARVHGLPII